MTLAELLRKFQSYKRVKENQEKERATFDYLLADLIGRSVGRLYNKNNSYPKINEVYSSLFPIDEEIEQETKDALSAIRFRQFANSFNKTMEGANK